MLLLSAYVAVGEPYSEGSFLLLLVLVVAAIIHGAVTIGLLTFGLIRYVRGDPAEANGLVRGWIYGVAANVLLLLTGVIVLRLTVYS